MDGLVVKDVEFNGATLRAAQDINNVIWVGVRWVCKGLGLSEGQMKSERKKIQTDLVLNKGTKFHPLGNDKANSDILCLMLDFLPLWLAKIHVTPAMKKENPELVDKLVEYQLKAKDVLAEAFLGNKRNVPAPVQPTQTIQLQMPSYDEKFNEMNRKLEIIYSEMNNLYSEIGKFANVIMDWKENSNTVPVKQNTTEIVCDPNVKKWKTKMYYTMDEVIDADDRFSSRAEVMSYLYGYLRKNYGIVWEQEIKDYVERYNCQKPSTIDVVYENEMFRSIFESVLFDLKENAKTERSKPEINVENLDDIIQPLAEKYNDESVYGMRTYKMVYDHMNQHNNISWKNRTTRYINKYGNRQVTKKKLIYTNPDLMKMFKASVKDLLEV